MAITTPPKPLELNRRGKWVRRGLVLAGLVAVLSIATYFFGARVLYWHAMRSLRSELSDAKSEYPETRDYEGLVRAQAKGTNGWLEIMATLEANAKLYGENSDGEGSDICRLAWDEQSRPSGGKLGQFLERTKPIANGLERVLKADCIVALPIESFAERERLPEWAFRDTLASRVVALSRLGQHEQASAELILVAEFCYRLVDRRSRYSAETWWQFRNDFLRTCIIPTLDRGTLNASQKQRLKKLRWSTPGNDPELWRLNFAWTVAYYSKQLANGEDEYVKQFLPSSGGEDRYRFYVINYIWGAAQHIRVAKRNAAWSLEGKLDLRDKAFVADYEADFEGWQPIDSAVP